MDGITTKSALQRSLDWDLVNTAKVLKGGEGGYYACGTEYDIFYFGSNINGVQCPSIYSSPGGCDYNQIAHCSGGTFCCTSGCTGGDPNGAWD